MKTADRQRFRVTLPGGRSYVVGEEEIVHDEAGKAIGTKAAGCRAAACRSFTECLCTCTRCRAQCSARSKVWL